MSSSAQQPALAARLPSPEALTWLLRLGVYPLTALAWAMAAMQGYCWQRQLSGLFGHSLLAFYLPPVILLLMMAAGAGLFGLYEKRIHRPLRGYAVGNLALGLIGLLWPFIPMALPAADQAIAGLLGERLPVLNLARGLLISGLLAFPGLLLGASYPALLRFMIRREQHPGLHAGGVMSALGLGVAAGLAIAGLLAAEWLGYRLTSIAAAVVMLAGSLALLIISRYLEPAARPIPLAPQAEQPRLINKSPYRQNKAIPQNKKRPSLPTPGQWAMHAGAGLQGGVLGGAIVLWIHLLGQTLCDYQHSPYLLPLTLGLAFAFWSLGQGLAGLFVDGHQAPMRLSGILLALTGLTFSFSAFIAAHSLSIFRLLDPRDFEESALVWIIGLLNVLIQSAMLVGLPCLAAGLCWPAAARLAMKQESLGRDAASQFVMLLTGLAGGMTLAASRLIQSPGATQALLWLGLPLILCGLGMLALAPGSRRPLILTILAVACLFGTVYLWLPAGPPKPNMNLRSRQIIGQSIHPLGSAIVTKDTLDEYQLQIDGVTIDGSTSPRLSQQKLLVCLPLLLTKAPESLMLVGLGSGASANTALYFDQLTRLDCVEPRPAVLTAAPWLSAIHHGRLEPGDDPISTTKVKMDNRLRLIEDDPGSWLRRSGGHYDVIATALTDWRDPFAAGLFNKDYFTACRQGLNETGIMAMQIPLAGLSGDNLLCALRTFTTVFPATAVFYFDHEPASELLLLGWREADQYRIDLDTVRRRLSEPDVRDELAEFYMEEPAKLISCLLTGGQPLLDSLEREQGEGIATDDRPILRYRTARDIASNLDALDEIAELFKKRQRPSDLLTGESINADDRLLLEENQKAYGLVIQGTVLQLREKYVEAARYYARAGQTAPHDLSIQRNLLTFPDLQREIQRNPGNPYPYLYLGQAYMGQESPERQTQAFSLLGEAAGRLQTGAGRQQDEEAKALLEKIQRWRAELNATMEPL